uniref:Uncharacterized protein n=1 Tax=Parascaris univalens TaxID=6257 RepID=A0A915B0I7_PARUN
MLASWISFPSMHHLICRRIFLSICTSTNISFYSHAIDRCSLMCSVHCLTQRIDRFNATLYSCLFHIRNTIQAISDLSDWCISGDCNIFIDYPSIYNRTTSTYISEVLLAQVITNDDNVSLVIVSAVRGEFSVPRLLSAKCTHECRRHFWANGEYCRMKCAENIRQSHISIIGSTKHDWQNFQRIVAVENIRKKYAAFIEPKFQ